MSEHRPTESVTEASDTQIRRSAGRIVLRTALLVAPAFAGGLLASSALSGTTPTAQRDCTLPLGCLPTLPTTVSTSVPTVTVPTPTLPTTTGQTTTPAGTASSQSTPSSAASTPPDSASPGGAASGTRPATTLAARFSARVLGHGARRVVEIRLWLSKQASVAVVLRRSGLALGQRLFQARAGRSVLRLRVAPRTRPGRAVLDLIFSSASSEQARARYPLVLPS